MAKVIKLLALAVLLVAATALPASADTIYTYTGNTFNKFLGGYTCPPQCNITGSFTVAQPLAANLSFATITPLSFSFTDGNFTITAANSVSFFGNGGPPFPFIGFSTDANGSLTTWFVMLLAPANGFNVGFVSRVGNDFLQTHIPAFDGSGHFITDPNSSFSGGSVINSAGVWSVSTTAPTPEPSSLVFLSTGMVALAAAVRRRLLR